MIQQVNAMKVCTDSCLFGAYIQPTRNGNILDIGTGTGLLALMLAQRYDSLITAVEIEAESAEEARQNITASKFKDNITVLTGDIRDGKIFPEDQKFDTIVCNPPFYEQQYRSENERRNVAMHASALGYSDLAIVSERVLHPQGEAFFLIPANMFDTFILVFNTQNLHLQQVCFIKNFTHSEPFRAIVKLGFEHRVVKRDSLTIYEKPNQYTPKAITLLNPYYLYL